jgi:glycosyltransferase involved in cell wall biosynthesis
MSGRDINGPLKLLFVAYYFPPLQAIGSVRAGYIAKYLKRIGWEVTVVTPHPSLLRLVDDLENTVAELDRLGIRRIYTGHRWRFLSSGFMKRSYTGLGRIAGGACRRLGKYAGINEFTGWCSDAIEACSGLTADDVDVIVATGSPWEDFTVASRLAEKIGRPFVLGYRDPWTADNPYSNKYVARRNRQRERDLLRAAAAVTAVTPSMAAAIEQEFGVKGKVHVVSNGYDPDDLAKAAPCDFGHFAIVYAGVFLPPKRSVDPLMSVLKRLSETRPNSNWRFHYYGPNNDYVQAAAKSRDLENRVVLHGQTSRKESLAAKKGAGAAVVIGSLSATYTLGDLGHVPAKIYEAIGSGTPVLAIAPPNSDLENIIRSAGGGRAFAPSQTEAMAGFLGDLMDGNAPKQIHPEYYSWPFLVHDLDRVLRGVVERSA